MKDTIIGYCNAYDYPVQFPLKSGRSAPMAVDGSAPIVTPEGMLVKPGQEELDDEVRIGTLVYIDISSPRFAKFKDWDKQAAQRNSSQHTQSKLSDVMLSPLPHTKPAPAAQQPPDFSVSADHPPTPTDVIESAKQKPHPHSQMIPGETLDSWMEREKEANRLQINGSQYMYEGQRFNGKKALAHYLESREVA